MTSNDRTQTGSTVGGRYRLKLCLGEGDLSALYVAEGLPEGTYSALGAAFGGTDGRSRGARDVAVRVYFPRDTGMRESILRRAEHLRKLDSPHVLAVLDSGTVTDGPWTGGVYLVTESWEGTFAEIIAQRTQLGEQELLQLLKDVAAALAHYECLGEFHGGVCPERVCRLNGRWKLAPAVWPDETTGGRCTGDAADSSGNGDAAEDVYALGLMVLDYLRTILPQRNTVDAGATRSQADLAAALSELPTAWRNRLSRCLAQEPASRCSAAELALDFADIPSPIVDITVRRYGDEYELSWIPPATGEVRLYVLYGQQPPAVGKVWLAGHLDHLGLRIALQEPTSARIRVENGQVLRVTIVTVTGEAAVLGETITLNWLWDVDRLKVTAEGEHLVARWEWPSGIQVAVVALREDRFAVSADDPLATVHRCPRWVYEGEGGFRFPIPVAGVVYVTVFAAEHVASGWRYSSGCTRGARCVAKGGRHCLVRYRVRKASPLAWLLLNRIRWELTVGVDRPADLPDLVLVGKEGGVPLNARDGVALLRIPGSKYIPGDPIVHTFETAKGFWKFRLFPSAPGCTWLRLIPKRGGWW